MNNTVSLNILLDYIYNRFAITLLLCILGGFIKECINSINKSNKLDLKRILVSSVFSAFLLCAFSEYLHVSFNVYAFLSVVFGMWGFTLTKLALNSNFVFTFVKYLIKGLKDPLSKTMSSTLEEINKEEKNEDKDDSENKNNGEAS